MQCGFDLRTGRKLQAPTGLATEDESYGPGPREPAEPRDVIAAAADSAKSALRGVGFSLLATLAGSVVWFLVAIATNYELGWIAWGVGALAGVFMAAGTGKADVLTGAAAGGIALFGILAAKVMIFAYFAEVSLGAAQPAAAGGGHRRHRCRGIHSHGSGGGRGALFRDPCLFVSRGPSPGPAADSAGDGGHDGNRDDAHRHLDRHVVASVV